MDARLDIPDVLGSTIQSHRLDLGIKAENMCEMLGCSAHHYSSIENGRSKPGYPALIAILRRLNIDPNIFVYPERKALDERRLQMIHTIETCDEATLEFLIAVIKALPKTETLR